MPSFRSHSQSQFSQSSFVASSLAHSPPVSTRQHNDTSSPVSLYYANARSIRCKSPQLSFILSSSQFRIICISESWLDHSDCDSLLVGGFSDYHSFRTDRVICENYGRSGGVACIVHSSLNPVLISSFSSPLIESCIVDLHPPITPSSPFKKIRLVTVYRSPSSPLSSLVSLLEHLEPLLSDEFPCVLVGDFNFPSIDWVSLSSPMPNDFLDFIAFHRFHQYVSFPSRLNNFLDLVFCNQDLIDNVMPSTPLSDHLSITLELRIPPPPPRFSIPSRSYCRADWQSINHCIFSHNWTVALNSLDAHESYDYFVDFVNHTLDTFVPMSKPSPHSRYPKNVRILYSKSRLLSRIAPNSIACKQMSQRFTVALDRFHCSLENRIVSSSNSKMFYSYCNDKLKPPKSTPSAILDSDGRLLLTNDQKCIAFDRYFCSVFTTPKLCNLPAPTSLHSFDLPFISAHDVIYALSKLAPKVNVTPDRIPSVVLSKCKLSIISPLVIIYNKSLLTSQVPHLWRQALVKPIPKKSSNSITDYRPISLTSSVCKVFEKILIRKITTFLDENCLFDPHQTGFRDCRSTSTNLAETFSHYLRISKKGVPFDTIYIDFKKAFDSIDHRLLLYKLSKLGFSDHLVAWLRSYLSGRTQSVFLDSSFSPPSPVISGVPQGSCLGPLLFILFINDICSNFPKSIYYSVYADDLKLFAESPLHSDDLQSALNIVSQWSAQWNLGISETKCNVVHYGPNNPRRQFRINNIVLNEPSCDPIVVKDLGVHFSPSLSFSTHINKILCKARSKSNLIFKSFRSNSPSLYLKTFTTFILPNIEYCSVIWNPVHSVELTKALEKIQRDFTRRMYKRCSLPPVPYRTRLHDLKLVTLERRRFIADIVFLHSILNGRYALDVSSLLTRAPPIRSLRNTHPLRISIPFIPHNSFSTLVSRTITIWNSLSPSQVFYSHELFCSFIRSQPPSFFPHSNIANWLDL